MVVKNGDESHGDRTGLSGYNPNHIGNGWVTPKNPKKPCAAEFFEQFETWLGNPGGKETRE